MIGVQKIHTPICEIVFRHTAVIDQQAAAWRQHSVDLLEGAANIGEVVRSAPARHELKRAVGKGEIMHISCSKTHIARRALGLERLRLSEHFVSDIDSDHRLHVRS
jgi:hypothetical protein